MKTLKNVYATASAMAVVVSLSYSTYVLTVLAKDLGVETVKTLFQITHKK